MTGVSLIITCFNDGRYLPEAVASARAQTHPEVELIVSDDGSTDAATLALLDRLIAEGVRVLRNPHAGLSANRNHALAATSETYVVCLDADDRLTPGYLAAAAAVLDAEPDVGIVVPQVQWFGDATHQNMTDYSIGRQLTGNRIVAAAMFRREDMLRIGGYDEALPHHEDYDAWLGILGLGRQARVIDLVGLERRARAGQMSEGMNPTTNPPVLAHILRKHGDLYADHAEEFWSALLAEREMLGHYKRRYGRVEDLLHRVAAWMRRR